MAHQPILRANDSADTQCSNPFPNGNPGHETRYPLAQLARTFAEQGAGIISADLALDIVLNDIVQQACIATGATGAAIALLRGDEMVCRATSGADAPDLGIRLDTRSGLSGACVQAREVQLCADAETDPRVDAQACQRAGIRSILVLPLFDGDHLFGVFEVLSRHPNAFGRLDTITVLGLAQQVVENHRQAHETTGQLERGALQLSNWQAPTVIPSGPAPAPAIGAEPELQRPEEETQTVPASVPIRTRKGSGIDFWTAFLAVLVVGATVLMSGLAGWRLGARSVLREHRTSSSRRPVSAKPAESASADLSPAQPATTSAVSKTSKPFVTPASKPRTSARAKPSPGVPAGGLVIYDKGKVVYRVSPSRPAPPARERQAGANQNVVVLAADTSPEIEEVPPEVAQARLVHRVEPQYSSEARLQHLEGPVELEAEISREGTVQKLTVLKGDLTLAQSAIEAVREWRYKPYKNAGRAVEIKTTITLNFTLPPE